MFRFFFIIFTIATLVSCQEMQTETLRIGTNTWLGYEPMYVTHQRFEQFQQTIKFIEYRNASQTLNGVINNAIDVAAVTLDEAVKLKALGYDIQVVWVTDFSAGADALITHPSITSAIDLKGKRIGVELSALGLYFMKRFFELHELSEHEVSLVNLEINRHINEYTHGKVDALFTFDPNLSKLIELGAVKLFDSASIPGEIVDVLIINNKTMTPEKQAVLVDFMHKNNQTITAINSNITPYINTLNQRLKLSSQQVKDAYQQVVLLDHQQVDIWLNDTQKQQRLVTSYNTILHDSGIIKQACDCASLVSTHVIDLVANAK